jgi:hypothetical protein
MCSPTKGTRAVLLDELWNLDGSKVDANGHSIKARLPVVAIVSLKLGGLTTLKTCAKWLGELPGGTTWVEEMMALEDARLQEVAST